MSFAARWLLRWESLLFGVLVAVLVVNSFLSPYFLDAGTLSDASINFTEKGLIALPMALLILTREIDVSVASIIAAASVAMGLAAQAGAPTPLLVLVGVGTGALAGAFNGLLVTSLRVPSIVATIGTMSLFRGIAYGILGDRVLKHYPASFDFFGQGYVFGQVSFELLWFVLASAACAVLLHRTSVGRRLYAIGAGPVAARYSGVAVQRYRFWLFVASGVASGMSAVMLTSRLASTRPTIATGWELDVVSMVILGGVAIAGGRGTILGVVLAAMIMGFVTFGLGLLNIPGIVLSVFVGALLIVVVALPAISRKLKAAGSRRAIRSR